LLLRRSLKHPGERLAAPQTGGEIFVAPQAMPAGDMGECVKPIQPNKYTYYVAVPAGPPADLDFDFDESDERFRLELRGFLDQTLPGDWISVFADAASRTTSDDVTRALSEQGYLIQHWPPGYGGRGASIWRQAVAQEELWARGEPRGGQYMNVNWIGPAIIHFGTDQQKAELLPEISAGGVTWAQLFSEPGAGSDLAAIATRAERTSSGDFIVNGQKVWTSYAAFASRGFLLARTDPAARRRQGLSVFLIDMNTPGVEVQPIDTSIGHERFCEVFFRDARFPASSLLGEMNAGWEVAMTALSFERSGTARYARSTRVLGHLERVVGEGDVVAVEEMSDLLAQGRAAELMNYAVVALKEQGKVPTWEASAARVQNVDYEQRVAALAERVLGPRVRLATEAAATRAEAEVASFAVTMAPTASIAAGTYEIQLGLIAARGLGLERAR
jgi:alkylation response protein AidB-like acyl-CoA dehydrogenase